MNVILNLGLVANLGELHYRKGITTMEKDRWLPVIDLPQHLVAAAVAYAFFGTLTCAAFIALPLTFKAVDLCTTAGTTINKIARAGDHVMRLASKITISTASSLSIFFAFAYPSSLVSRLWTLTRTSLLLYSYIQDATAVARHAKSGTNNFETTIYATYFRDKAMKLKSNLNI